jgi:5-methylcytosine-specific restriction endonuclease McrA
MTNPNETLSCANCGHPLPPEHPGRPGWAFCEQCNTPPVRRERDRVLTHLRRAHSAGLPATLTLSAWLHTLQDFSNLCAYCQKRPFEALEHFVPIDAGGGTTAQNCVPTCGRCNYSKGTTNPDSHQLDLFINETRERVRRYLAGRAQTPFFEVDSFTDLDDLQDGDCSR